MLNDRFASIVRDDDGLAESDSKLPWNSEDYGQMQSHSLQQYPLVSLGQVEASTPCWGETNADAISIRTEKIHIVINSCMCVLGAHCNIMKGASRFKCCNGRRQCLLNGIGYSEHTFRRFPGHDGAH